MWLLFLFFLLTKTTPAYSFEIYDSGDVSVSASIGENEVTIFGYTSPLSQVELSGINIYSKDYSDDTGYFEFNKLVLPKNPSELCFQSQDHHNRSSSLLCLPPPPATNYHTDIGPIILPPTISIDKSDIDPHSTVISSGQSIPNSKIILYFYKTNNQAKSFPKSISAYSLPEIETQSDDNGFYSINLPTAYSSDYRLYSSVNYQNSFSPKSNTLLYLMPSLFWLFIQKNIYLIFLFSLFIFSLLLFFTLLYLNSRPLALFKPSLFPLALRSSYPAIKKQHYPSLYPDKLARNSKIPR